MKEETVELNNKDVKDLLLEDYRYLGESLRKNEESGESRVNFYITILAVIPVAIAALSDKKDGPVLDIPDVQYMLLITLVSFFIFGIFIFLRLVKRNKITDELKFALDNIRQQYKDIYDPSSFLSYRILSQKENPVVSLTKEDTRSNKNESRGWGSLAHLVALLNSMVIASIFFIIFYRNTSIAFMIASIFLLTLFVHKNVIASKEKKVRQKIKSACFTHAGGIVYRRIKQQQQEGDGNTIEYLITTNKPENQARDGKKYLFPRGHIERNEEISQAALREVYEEVGAVAHIIKPAGFYFEDSKPPHMVKLYLMELLHRGQSKEDRELYWLPFEKAYAQLSFPESKGMIIQVHSFLLSNALLNNHTDK